MFDQKQIKLLEFLLGEKFKENLGSEIVMFETYRITREPGHYYYLDQYHSGLDDFIMRDFAHGFFSFVEMLTRYIYLTGG